MVSTDEIIIISPAFIPMNCAYLKIKKTMNVLNSRYKTYVLNVIYILLLLEVILIVMCTYLT